MLTRRFLNNCCSSRACTRHLEGIGGGAGIGQGEDTVYVPINTVRDDAAYASGRFGIHAFHRVHADLGRRHRASKAPVNDCWRALGAVVRNAGSGAIAA